MVFAFVNVWVILVWLHLPSNKIHRNCLQALNLHRLSFLPQHRSTFQWRGGGGSPTAVSSSTATSTPRKYRHLDVQEEFARDRSGAFEHHLPHQWLGRIKQTVKPQRRHGDDSGAIDDSQLPGPAPPPKTNEASIPIPLLQSLLRKKQHQHIVTSVNELRSKILDDGLALPNVKIECPYASANATIADVLQHDVIQIMASRYHSQSRPGQRYINDTAYLALAIEGGGVRGAVCSGMAAAIATLGLTDSFDTIIGSSAGSVIGAYMVRYADWQYQICCFVFIAPYSYVFISLLDPKADKCALMFTWIFYLLQNVCLPVQNDYCTPYLLRHSMSPYQIY